MMEMRLVKPDLSYKEQCEEYRKEHIKYNSQMHGSGGWSRYPGDYEGWLRHIEEERHPKEDGIIPTETYLLIRTTDNKLIGMVNIRTRLNENLKRCGGHIGYGIRPTERNKGYNKINLYLALKRCQELNIDMVLLDCQDSNIASYKTMEALGGIWISTYIDEKYGLCRKYAVETNKSIEQYATYYEAEHISQAYTNKRRKE